MLDRIRAAASEMEWMAAAALGMVAFVLLAMAYYDSRR